MYYFDFDPVKSPPKYSSVILPTCEARDHCLFRYFGGSRIIFTNIDICCPGLRVINAMECYEFENEKTLISIACCFSRFRHFPYFIYNDAGGGNSYLYDLRNEVKKCLGKTLRTETCSETRDNIAALIYGDRARQIKYCHAQMVGFYVMGRPGFREAMQKRTGSEEKLFKYQGESRT